MPGTTPVYGFPYPEPTDLVADYPALGQQLAEDIEAVLPTLGGLSPATPTSIANSGGTATLSSNTVTFSGVTSVSLNGVFNATCDNYRIVITVTSNQASATTLNLRLRASGTDSSTSYNDMITYATSSSGPSRENTSLTQAVIGWAGNATTSAGQSIVDIANPFVAAGTGISFVGYGFGATTSVMGVGGNDHRVATSYDGFSFFGTSGTITGTVAVYGYKK